MLTRLLHFIRAHVEKGTRNDLRADSLIDCAVVRYSMRLGG